MENSNQGSASSREIDLLEIVTLVWNRRAWMFISAGVLAVTCAMVQFLLAPKYRATAIFVLREEKNASPLEAWGALAEQFGYRLHEEVDPLLSMVERVLGSEDFFRPMMPMVLSSGHPDSSLSRLLQVDTLPDGDKVEVFTAKMARSVRLKHEKDDAYTLTVRTKIPHLSQFLADAVVDGLNSYFAARQKREEIRKLEFLETELRKNRIELDSISGDFRHFLEFNKDFSSPLLNFQYLRLKREESISTEKYLVTMKAYQSVKISASQPRYFFEIFSHAKLPKPPSIFRRLSWIGMAFGGGLFTGAIVVILLEWLVRIRRRGGEA